MPFSNIPVLLVEDDLNTRLLVQTVLQRKNFSLDVALNGEEAIEKIRRKWYAVILLDLLMPVRNGFDVVAYLKALQPRLLKRVVVITAASDATIGDFDRTQVFALLRKPCSIESLVTSVSECAGLNGDSRRAALAVVGSGRIQEHR